MSELPIGWAAAKLSAVAAARMGKTILSKQLVASGLPVFSASVGSEPWGYVDDWSTVFPRGTLVISARGTIGDVKLPEHDWFVSTQTTIALQPSGAVIPSFLTKQLSAFDWPSVTSTTAIPMLTIGKLDEVRVLVPPHAEQRRIVAKLDALTARTARARADLDRIPALAARYKQAVLAKAFNGELTRAMRSVPDDSETGSPGGWRTLTLGEFSDIQSGIALGKKRAAGVATMLRPYLRVANVQRGWLRLDEIKEVAVTSEEFERLRLEDGDILMNEGGDLNKLGRGWVWRSQVDDCVHQNHVFRVRLKDRSFPPEYVSHYANELGQRYFLDTGKQTTNLASISKSKVAALPVPLPPADEAHEIVRRIDHAFAEIDRLAAEAAAACRLLGRLDQAVFAQAFRGELVPQDPADESASVLLDRIRAERTSAPKATRARRKAAA